MMGMKQVASNKDTAPMEAKAKGNNKWGNSRNFPLKDTKCLVLFSNNKHRLQGKGACCR
ncbi:hypothetical protein J26TS2_27920 [Shouchella clausii]|nr:hypothetical protein J26TS2_27920 [Shouchella clausii]